MWNGECIVDHYNSSLLLLWLALFKDKKRDVQDVIDGKTKELNKV